MLFDILGKHRAHSHPFLQTLHQSGFGFVVVMRGVVDILISVGLLSVDAGDDSVLSFPHHYI